MKKFLKILLIAVLATIALLITAVSISFPPIMAGMAAKTVCSCVYVSGRTVESVREKELTVFPGLDRATIVLEADSSVTASILFTKAKAIYRKGLGCTLLAERSEAEVRAQQFQLAQPPTYSQDSLAWPQGNRVAEVPNAINAAALRTAVEKAFEEPDTIRPKNTLAVAVVYDGQLVAERYAEGRDEHSKLMGWSMTKSITSALMGILVREEKLDVNAPAPISEWRDERSPITLNQLLQATSGLQWSETYFNPFQDFHQMFTHSDDKGGFAATRPLQHKPGTVFQYSSGTTNILSRMLREQTGDTLYHRFPYERLFYKIGMLSTVIEPDASGTFVGSSYSFATARDWARFGLLYLNDGVWMGQRILPEGWVRYTTTPSAAAPQGEYGAQWWLNVGALGQSENRQFKKLPVDTFWADGFESQYVLVIPSRKVVVVRLGVSHNGFDMEQLVTEILDALPQ
jgi:CubicO group peptidase (beta-lactamase class C family)